MAARGLAADRPDDATPKVEEKPRPRVGPQLRSQQRGPFHACDARFVAAEEAGETDAEVKQGLVVRAPRQEWIGQLNLGVGAHAAAPRGDAQADWGDRPAGPDG